MSVNAISWAALAPASRKCAPATEIALKRGTSCGAELDRVGDEPQRRAGRPDPRAAADVLLEDVVLDRAAELRPVDALLLADGDVEREQDRGGAVDREAGADPVERDLVEEDLGVGERVERDADPADLLLDVGVVGVVAALRREVERDRQAGAALREQVAVALVRLLGGAEARVLADRPEAAAVAVGEVAPGEGERAGRGDRLRRREVGRSVARRQRDARPRCAPRRSGVVGHGRAAYAEIALSLNRKRDVFSGERYSSGGVRYRAGCRVEIDAGVAVVTIDRPEVRNAIGFATVDELDAALDDGRGGRRRRARAAGRRRPGVRVRRRPQGAGRDPHARRRRRHGQPRAAAARPRRRPSRSR